MLTEVFNNNEFLLKAVVFISAIGVIISGLEWIALKKYFNEGDLFSWNIRQRGLYLFLKHKRTFHSIYSKKNLLTLITIKVLSAIIVMIFINDDAIIILPMIIISIISIILSLKTYIGYTGADQMFKITFITASTCILFKSESVYSVGLIFLAIQLIISYATPGLMRIFQKEWRNGNHLIYITRQHTYGNKYLFKTLKESMLLRKVSAYGIGIFEIGSLVAFLLPIEFVIAYLLIGLFFHIMNSIVMGLNTFIWGFIGVYPAYMWLALAVNRQINSCC